MQADQPPTDFQLELAEWLGVDVEDSTRWVAAARLEDAVSPAIEPDEEIEPVSERQRQLADELGLNVEDETSRVAYAKIGEEYYRRNKRALEESGLEPGDRVRKKFEFKRGDEVHVFHREYTVSSIGDDLKVYFKGGGGKQAWPTELELAEDPETG